MGDWDVVSPAGADPWAVVSDPWAVVKAPETAGGHVKDVFSRGAETAIGGIKEIVKGVGELGGDLSNASAGVNPSKSFADPAAGFGVERTAEGGLVRHGKPVGMRLRPGVEDIAAGGLGLQGGAVQALTSPLTAANPAIERATGIPTSVTDLAAPMLVPLGGYAAGRGAARLVPETVKPKAPTLVELKARGGNTVAVQRLETVNQLLEDAAKKPFADRQSAIRDGVTAILGDPKKAALYTDAQREQMARIVKGTKTGNLANWLGETFGVEPKNVANHLLAALAAGTHGVKSLAVTVPSGLAGEAIGLGSTTRQTNILKDIIGRESPFGKSKKEEANPVRAFLDKLFPPFGGAAKPSSAKPVETPAAPPQTPPAAVPVPAAEVAPPAAPEPVAPPAPARVPRQARAIGSMPFPAKSMIDDAEAYKAAAKKRREASGGEGAVKVLSSNMAIDRVHGLNVAEAREQHAKYGKAFDDMLIEHKMAAGDVPDDVRALAVEAMTQRGFSNDAAGALDYAMAKAERDALADEDLHSLLAGQDLEGFEAGRYVVENEDRPHDVQQEIPFEAGEGSAATRREGAGQAGPAPAAGSGAREDRAGAPERGAADTSAAVGLGALAPVQPLMRSVIERGRSGRPTVTEPIGKTTAPPQNVISLGQRKADRAARVEPSIDRVAMKQAILRGGGLPQKEIDQLIDHAIEAAKRYGSAKAAAEATRMEGEFWDKRYKAALGAME